jgi:hypothetical protein
MFKQRLKEPFGKAGLTVAILALVLAMVGGAYAAGKLTGPQKKEVEKIAKKFAGKPGATGTAGSPGATGKNGTTGTNGTNGTPGESVTSKTIAGPAGCVNGGSEFKVGSNPATFACNGKNGTTGFTEVLPSGKTEKGTWAVSGNPTGLGFFHGLLTPISFVIPLATGPEPIVVGVEEIQPAVFAPEPTPPGCLGNVEEPGAEKGKLCIFIQPEAPVTRAENLNATIPIVVYDPSTGNGGAAGPAGATLTVNAEEESEPITASGTWAVTAE